MLRNDADGLRRAWKGGACEHACRERLVEDGCPTGDLVCTECGEEFWDGHPVEERLPARSH